MKTSVFPSVARLSLVALFTAVTTSAWFAGCGSSNDSSSGTTCGAGTKNENGQCVPDGTGGTAGGGGSAGAGGNAGSAGSAGTGGIAVTENDPCPSDPDGLLMQCTGGETCPQSTGSSTLCDNLLCVNGQGVFTTINYAELVELEANAKPAFVRTNYTNLPPTSCKLSTDCQTAPESGFLYLAVGVLDPSPLGTTNTGKDLVVRVAPPWGILARGRLQRACFDEAVQCLQMPVVKDPNDGSLAQFAAISQTYPPVYRNIEMRLVDEGTQGCP